MTDPRYPIGRVEIPVTITAAIRAQYIEQIKNAPGLVRAAIAGLNDAQLDTPYREGGWTVRQVVHHLADSHAHSYVRFKFALAEEQPSIKPYDENVWAAMEDAARGPAEPSLLMLEGMHSRWIRLMGSLQPEAFSRTLLHPERGLITLDAILAIYSWHGRHHAAQITSLRERLGW